VIPAHRPGIVNAPQRRFTIRDLFPNVPTNSNLVEFASELVFTNNAGPQGGFTSPTSVTGEGEIKPESAMTFQLSNTPVITLAHFIPHRGRSSPMHRPCRTTSRTGFFTG